MSPVPPRLPTRLLEAVLPPGPVGRSIVGDLEEEWSRKTAGAGRTVWYVSVALALAARYAFAGAIGGGGVMASETADALRRLARSPVQNLVTALALGLGIAAPATMFSVTQGLLRDIDVEEPERLVHFGRRFTPEVIGITRLDRLWPALEDVDDLEAVGWYRMDPVDLSGDGGPAERRTGAFVTPGAFRAFGTGPALGRTFVPRDATGSPVVVLGWELWRARFGGDRSLLGRTVRVDGTPRTVVGVMREGFRYPSGAELWLPLDPGPSADSGEAAYLAVGRLAAGASMNAVLGRVAGLDAALRAELGGELLPGSVVAAQSWRHKQIAPTHRRIIWVMLLVVSSVLLIACADVVNLMLARALGRSRQTAVRVALGAGRWRLLASHLAEGGALAVTGGAFGLALTLLAVRGFEATSADFLAHWMDFRIDGPVLLFGAGLVVVASLATGLVPALQSARVDLVPSLRDGDRGASSFRIGRLGGWLVAGEVALSCTLLVVAGLMVRGALTTLRTDGSYATESVLTASYELRAEAYPGADEVLAFHRRLVEHLGNRPGVLEAALTSHLPGVFAMPRRVEIEGHAYERPEDRPTSHRVVVSPTFLDALESRLIAGRPLTWEDGRTDPPAAWVNEAFARTHLAGRDPIGARVRMVSGGAAEDEPWLTVVGVVPSLGVDVGRDVDGTAVYLPLSGSAARSMTVVLRATHGTDPLALLTDVRASVAALDPDVALYGIDTLAGHVATTRAAEAIFAGLFLVFGAVGLLLAVVGLYGVLAFTVRRRVRELGVRVALGAGPVRVLRSALGGGLVRLASGLVVGLGLAALVAPLLGEALLGADPRDPWVYGAIGGLLALAGLAASLSPARRALGVDVMETLRAE